MRIAFVDLSDLDYQLDAIDDAPLGGSQSAMLIVADELARAGATVYVMGMHLKHEVKHRGVVGLNMREASEKEFGPLDALISVNYVIEPKVLKRMFPRRRPRMIHWHKNDALAIYAGRFAKREFYAHIDRFVFCSHYQTSAFVAQYGLPYGAITVIPNPLAQVYFGLFDAAEPVLAAKDPDLLIYASAPNRGLEGLLKIVYPDLLKRRPKLRLEAYSGFYLDQGAAFAYKGTDITAHYQELVRTASSMPGVTCHPGVPKSVLAQRMRRAGMLCYPTIFRETSCHVALEAMAAGCMVCSTTIGALPETTAGFGWLTPASQEDFEPALFTKNTLKALEERDRDPAGTEARLKRQIQYVNETRTPAVIGALWREFLETELRQHARA